MTGKEFSDWVMGMPDNWQALVTFLMVKYMWDENLPDCTVAHMRQAIHDEMEAIMSGEAPVPKEFEQDYKMVTEAHAMALDIIGDKNAL